MPSTFTISSEVCPHETIISCELNGVAFSLYVRGGFTKKRGDLHSSFSVFVEKSEVPSSHEASFGRQNLYGVGIWKKRMKEGYCISWAYQDADRGGVGFDDVWKRAIMHLTDEENERFGLVLAKEIVKQAEILELKAIGEYNGIRG